MVVLRALLDSLKHWLQPKHALAAGVLLGLISLIVLAYTRGWWGTLVLATGSGLWLAVLMLLLVLAVGLVVAVLWWRPRYREQRFLAQLRAEDPKASPGDILQHHSQLRDKMLEAIRTLESSPELRRKGGSPLYALPWYLLIGARGSGKTALLGGVANRFPPFALSASAVQGPTQNCDWWFFNTAIILDTAGRYASPTAEGQDGAEWYRLLQLLRHYRAQQPLNGLIVAIAADALASRRQEEVRAEAAELRRRIDEASQVLGLDFPVYLLITQCDLIDGFTEFFGRLPERTRQQGFGHVFEPRSPGAGQPLDTATPEFASVLGSLTERLEQLRLSLLKDKLTSATLGQKIFCFPEEFHALQGPLTVFGERLFSENPARRTPFFRGLFFCSAQQQGTPVSVLRRQWQFAGEGKPQGGESKPYFLHDLFSVILPRDRYWAKHTAEETRWRWLRRVLGTATCIGLCALAVLCLRRAYLSDWRVYSAVDARVCDAAPEPLGTEPLLDEAEGCRQIVQTVITQNHARPSWHTIVFNKSGKLEGQLRQRYVEKFQAEVLGPLDPGIDQRLMAADDSISWVFLLIKRLELVARCQAVSGCTDSFGHDVQPDYALMLKARAERPPAAERVALLQRTDEAYLRWSSDTAEVLRREQDAHSERIRRWFASQQFATDQILRWANQHYPPVSEREYWGAPLQAAGSLGAQVEGAYTRAAWEGSLLPFLRRAEQAAPGMAGALEQFTGDYRQQYFERWRLFLAEVSGSDLSGWRKRDDRQQLALKLIDESSPLNRLIDVTFDNIKPLLPPVLVVTAPVGSAEDPALTAAEATIPGWIRVMRRYIGSETRKAYLEGLRQVGDQLAGGVFQDQSLKLAQAVFQETRPSPSATQPLLKAWSTISQFRDQMGPNAEGQSFWPVLESPVHLVWKVILDEAAVALQKRWTEVVIAPTEGLSQIEQLYLLYGPQGKLRGFTDQLVKPFLADDDSRLGHPVLGRGLPLSPMFLKALQNEKQLSTYMEVMKRTPPLVRVAATRSALIDGQTNLREERTEFLVKCGSETFKVDRAKDTPEASATVFWSLDGCGDVVITLVTVCEGVCLERSASLGIVSPETPLRLTKRYPGQTGLWRFMEDFQAGFHDFSAKDFVGAEEALRRHRVRVVKLFYQVEPTPLLQKFLALVRSTSVPPVIIAAET
jgi:type VI secretion system protein ImpL